jgi:hypothetical protein
MVRPSGVEPPLLSEHGPEPCASANSATGAQSIGRPEIERAGGIVKNWSPLPRPVPSQPVPSRVVTGAVESRDDASGPRRRVR